MPHTITGFQEPQAERCRTEVVDEFRCSYVEELRVARPQEHPGPVDWETPRLSLCSGTCPSGRPTFLKQKRPLWLVLAGFLSLIAGSANADAPPPGPRVELRMSSVPAYELRQSESEQFDDRLLPLWLKTFDLPERDLHRQAADAIVRARDEGLIKADKRTADRLRKAFEEADHPVVRRSLARALIAFDDRKSASLLFEAGRGDYQLALIGHPALGTWRHEPAIEWAVQQLGESASPEAIKRLAIDVLAHANEASARKPLVDLVQDVRAPGDLRLASADALARIFSENLEAAAKELTARSVREDPLALLFSARMLQNHESADSIALLQKLAEAGNSAVQASALSRLGEIDHSLAAKFALDEGTRPRFSVKHPDANVRRALIESLYSISQTDAVAALSEFLDDPHPQNRVLAADALFDLAGRDDRFKGVVEAELAKSLKHASWRVLEQAAILAAGLDYEAGADDLVRLLDHRRVEVTVASAYALKQIAVPETLPAALKRLQANLLVKPSNSMDAAAESARRQSPHLCEMFGIMNYRPADDDLRRLVPIVSSDRELHNDASRAAAVWALGLLYKDSQDAELTSQFISRMNAIDALENPESVIVAEACAYAVGWMGRKSAVSALKTHAGRSALIREYAGAAAWAIARITGKPLPLPDPFISSRGQYFLVPRDAPDS